jgi:ABC-type multidrug transport system fused ATPase/permease subunit
MAIADWRGIPEDVEGEAHLEPDTSPRMRAASRRMLLSLLGQRRCLLAATAILLLTQNAAELAGPYLVKIGIDHGIPPLAAEHDPSVLAVTAAAFLGFTIVRFLAKRSFLALSGRIGQSILLDLRRRVYSHFQQLSVGFHERYTSGRVVARLTSDMESIAELTDGGLDELVLAAVSMVSVLAVLFWLDVPMALITLASFPFMIALSIWFHRKSAVAYHSTREAVALLITHFTESLSGIRAVQVFRREERDERLFVDVNARYERANLRTMRLSAILAPGTKLIGNITTAAVLTFGGYRVLHGQAQLGVLVAFLLYLRRFFEPIHELSLFFNTLQSAVAALEKIANVLEETPSVAAPRHPVPLPNVPLRGEVRLDAVRFGYRPGRVVLPRLTMQVPAGQTVALVGATGSGKSTIAKLVARFYDPGEGTVALDGFDVRRIGETDLRRSVVMVPQDSFLFSGSVADNIGFGNPDASRTQIEQAAVTVGADAFIRALPNGYDTDVHRRGCRLAAGQRQLVTFARVFLAAPSVLILDEATSALDIPSERLVQRALRTLVASRTAIVIAHRLSTVAIADRVLVIEDGQIVEDGAPGDLIAAGGRYAALHQQWVNSLR